MSPKRKQKAFSLAEALITLLIVAIITLATIPVITKKHRSKNTEKHGMYACYWNGNSLVARQMINGDKTSGTTQYDPQEGRQGCVFNPPPGAKNFVVTVVGGGGGGAGSGATTGDKRIYTEPGDYTFTTPEPGIYQFLAVGGGGGGGFHSNTAFVTSTGAGSKNVQVKDGQQYRACSGTPGGLIYVPNQKLNKDVKFNIKVGAGGASSSSESRAGANGGETVILETLSGKMYAHAGGGGGGCSYSTNQCYTINVSSGKIQPLTNRIYGKSAGYDSTGIFLSNDFGSNVSGTNKSNYENYIKSLYSAKTGEISSDINSAQKYNSSVSGGVWSNVHKNSQRYKNIDALSSYNDKFGINFNQKVKLSKYKRYKIVLVEMSGMNINYTTRPDISCGSDWQNVYACQDYNNNYGAGGGGRGAENPVFYPDAFAGKGGFVGISYRPIYAGTGGKAGKAIQIPYAELPSKTLLFPGKGGLGGTPAKNIYMGTTTQGEWQVYQYTNNAMSAGKQGQSSYIKNGSEIMGGAGAGAINPDSETTYSQVMNPEKMPVGTNGELSNVLTNQKVGNGGLGGLNQGEIVNSSIHGMTQSVFRNNAEIASFKNIYGAGSGGGGGTVSATGTNLNFGSGGNGSSGLVFIQW